MKLVVDIPEKKYKAIQKCLESGFTLGSLDIAILNGKPLPQCKDCRHFETDVLVPCSDIPLIIGHEVCTKWGSGCKTKEDGYCFMFEPKEVEE